MCLVFSASVIEVDSAFYGSTYDRRYTKHWKDIQLLGCQKWANIYCPKKPIMEVATEMAITRNASRSVMK